MMMVVNTSTSSSRVNFNGSEAAHDNQRGLILVTGGTGYIGSHCCVELLKEGWDVAIIDNLCNSSADVISVIEKLGGRSIKAFHQIDLCDLPRLESVFASHTNDLTKATTIHTVIHFAGLKAVGESSQDPLRYYDNNLKGSINLLRQISNHQVKNLIYSSSATVYGDSPIQPIDENCPLQPTSPYGHTKLWIEQMVSDTMVRNGGRALILRYFNPVGAHSSGILGEVPRGRPNNLMPYLAQVAQGKLPYLPVYGADYFTPDGTGVRDYIHVVDLVRGHLAALRYLSLELPEGKAEIFNLGTGKGYSVMEMIQAFSDAVGQPLPYVIKGRRPGDVATLIADPHRATTQLRWHPELTLLDMCQDLWKWTQSHPNGFQPQASS